MRFTLNERTIEMRIEALKNRFIRCNYGIVQFFYAETMAALGDKKNSSQFRLLAEGVTWERLPENEEAAIIILLGTAKLLPYEGDEKNRKIWDYWFLHSAEYETLDIKWDFPNKRSQAFLRQRLKKAASMFCERGQISGRTVPLLYEKLMTCDLSSRNGWDKAIEVFNKTGHVGVTLAKRLLTDIVIPFAYLEGVLKASYPLAMRRSSARTNS